MNSAHQKFDDKLMKQIAVSLPDCIIDRRLKLLPRILDEWFVHYLPAALWRPDPDLIAKQVKSLQQINTHASKLLGAIAALDKENGGFILLHQLSSIDKNGDFGNQTSLIAVLNEHRAFLNSICLATSDLSALKRGTDQRRNTPAYLVMKDIAAIFEWLTGTRAARRIERGPDTFGRFAEAIWPVVFESADDGLQSALKNWAADRARYREESALIANINMRHPTWRVFDV